MREYLTNVCLKGTGKTAVPAGYVIGGKTGTAEKQPRGNGNYVMSFMGFAPVDDPQVVVYCVIDEPNVADQPHSTFAQEVVKSILTEALPYLHIYRTEELTEEQEKELAEMNLLANTSEDEEAAEGEDTETAEDSQQEGEDGADTEQPAAPGSDFAIDEATGYAIDPGSGELLHTDTYSPVDPTSSDLDGLIGIENDPAKAVDDSDLPVDFSGISDNRDVGIAGDTPTSGVGAGSAIDNDIVTIEYKPQEDSGNSTPAGTDEQDFGAGAGF